MSVPLNFHCIRARSVGNRVQVFGHMAEWCGVDCPRSDRLSAVLRTRRPASYFEGAIILSNERGALTAKAVRPGDPKAFEKLRSGG